MVERIVIDKDILMKKLDSMHYKYLSELQIHHIFRLLGYKIQIEEEGDNDAVQTDCGEPEQPSESDRDCAEEQGN